MSKYFKKRIYIENFYVPLSKRTRGNSLSYIIQYNRGGYHISVSSTTIKGVIDKFIEKVNQQAIEKEEKEQAERLEAEKPQTPKETPPKIIVNTCPTFCEKLLDYMENYKKRKIASNTFIRVMNRIENHILPFFNGKQLQEINVNLCQTFLDNLTQKKMFKTAHDLYFVLNGFFKYLINSGETTLNPLSLVILEKYEQKHGTALSKKEEKFLLENCPAEYKTCFAVALYTGMRPNEYSTAKIENGFIVCNNSKRKNGKKELKKIPIHPMLKKYISKNSLLNFPQNINRFRLVFKNILPNHILYDLRTTFYTRLCECSVSPYARDFFIGHSSNALQTAYLDLTDDFLIAEAEKINYKI